VLQIGGSETNVHSLPLSFSLTLAVCDGYERLGVRTIGGSTAAE